MSDYYSSPSHFMPLPELLSDEPGTYDIIDSRSVRGLPTNGMVDTVNQVMLVPLEAAGRVVSRHECAHVLWTPHRLPKVRGYRGYFQAVEDGRINRGLQYIGLAIELDPKQIAEVVTLGEHDLEHEAEGLVHWALRCVAAYGTNVAGPLLALVPPDEAPQLPFGGPVPPSQRQRVRELVVRTHTKLERARRRQAGPVGSEKSTLNIARWLRRELLKLRLPEPENRGTLVCCLGAGGVGGEDILDGRLGRVLFRDGPGPGEMRIAEPALPHACAPPPRGSSRGRRSANEGTQLRDISRFAHDQRVFAARSRRRRGGGSVLIDASGSMSLDSEAIDQIIAGAPAATLVAIYSGRRTEGELRIVVRDGRRVGREGLKPYGHANVVDQPALEWLAKQPAPRIWLSDGGVTGIDDTPSRDIKRACARVCRRARIERVDDAAAAATALARRGRR